MTTYAKDYEDVRKYTLDSADEEKLLSIQKECVFMWTNKKGEPVGVIQSFIAIDGKLWLTAAEQRKRISAIRRDPRSCVCISSLGTEMGRGKSITYKGATIIHPADDRELKDWFYPRFAEKRCGDQGPEYVERFIRYLDSPSRVIMEFTPEKKILYDAAKMEAATEPLDSEKGTADN